MAIGVLEAVVRGISGNSSSGPDAYQKREPAYESIENVMAAIRAAQGDETRVLSSAAWARGESEDHLSAQLAALDREIVARTLPDQYRHVLVTPDLLQCAVCGAIQQHKIDSALKLLGDNVALQNGRSEHITLFRTVGDFVARRAEGSGQIQDSNEELFVSIYRTGVLPSQAIWKTFQYFGREVHPFLISILAEKGESFGTQVLDELRVIFEQRPQDLSQEMEIVKAFLGSGYRGFSARTYNAFHEAFNRSEIEARYLLDGWKRVSRKLLTGREVPDDLKADPLLVDFVIGAYRPAHCIGPTEGAPAMSTSEVEELLDLGGSFQQHLLGFQYPRSGYPTCLATETSNTLTAQAQERLQRCREFVNFEPNETVPREKAILQMVRLLQGAVDEVDRKLLLAYLTQSAGADSDLRALVKECRSGSSDAGQLQQIRNLKFLISDAFEEHLLSVICELAAEVPLSGKLEPRVRKALGIGPDEMITPQALTMLLSLESSKIFAKELSFLKAQEKLLCPGKSGAYTVYVSKAAHCFLARSSAALCTSHDTWSWRNPNYLQMTMVDNDGDRVAAVIQLHLFTDNKGKPSILARLSPTEAFVGKVDKPVLAHALLSVVSSFARDNNLVPYLPEQGEYRMLTNRNSFVEALTAFYGEESQEVDLQVTGQKFQNIKKIYRLKISG